MRDAEVSALKTLRDGFFYLFTATAILIAVVGFAVVFYTSNTIVVVTFLAFSLPAVAVVFLYAVFVKVRRGMRRLSEVDSRFRICYVGVFLMFVGLVIMVSGTIVVVAIPLSSLILAVGAFYVGSMTAFAGYMLTFVLGAFRLYEKYQNPLYAAAGTFIILDLILAATAPFELNAALTLVGLGIIAATYILMYVALGDTVKKLNRRG